MEILKDCTISTIKYWFTTNKLSLKFDIFMRYENKRKEYFPINKNKNK